VSRRHRFYGVVLIAVALLAAGCIPVAAPPTTTTTTTTTNPPYVGTLLPPGAPNPYGPQGKGEFVATCPFSHRATQDPIVAPGNFSFWHLHDFFGNGTTDANSVPEFLLGQDTSCIPAFDATGYWVPAVMQNGAPLTAVSADFFYRVVAPQDPSKVQPFPAGLIMVAGSAGATTEQPAYIEQWSCAGTPVVSAVIPTCASGHNLHLTLNFPECWDGVHLDSADHKSHMAYAQGKSCPQDHPVLVPQLTFDMEWTITGPGVVTVSSDHTMSGSDVTPGLTAHGDFMDGWNPETLEQRTTHCLQAAVICDKNGVITGS
jgi:uncharacterized protein DUF1996